MATEQLLPPMVTLVLSPEQGAGVVVVIACDDVGPDVVGADVVGARVVVGCGVDGADVEVVVRDGSCVVVGLAVVVGPTVVVAGCGVVPV